MELTDQALNHTALAVPKHVGALPKHASVEGIFPYNRTLLHNALALATGDLAALAVAVLASGTLARVAVGSAYTVPFWVAYLFPTWYCGAALLRLLPGWGLGSVEELRRLTILSVAVYGSLFVMTAYGEAITALYVSRPEEPAKGLELGMALLISAFMVPFVRTRVKRGLLGAGRWGIPAVVFGEGQTRDAVVSLLEGEKGMGYTPVHHGDIDAALRGARTGAPPSSVAVLAVEGIGRARARRLLEGPLSAYRTVIVIPDLLESPSLWVRPRDLRGVLGLEITSNLTRPTSRVTKRAFDALLVLATSPLWLPLCGAIAAFIWIEDRKNPLFLQERVGAGGRRFKTFKFRTMYPDAEAVLQRSLESDPELRREWETHYKLRRDPRITRVGRVLRRLSLDELPQLLNVLRGEMSLVGPRPLPAYHHQALPPRVQKLRQRVRPGITGLWQVSGRSDIGNEGMKLWDPYYVRNWSLWLDAVILVRTLRAVTGSSGAY